MNFTETIAKLYEETESLDLYGMISYGDAAIGIGFRTSFGSRSDDPIIDGNVFMIAASAWNIDEHRWIETTTELLNTPKDAIEIRLRASYSWPMVTIGLGDYIVESMKVETFIDVAFIFGYQKFPERIRLHIKRK